MTRFAAAIVAVLSAFIGIRKRGAALHDQSLKPIHFIVAALLCIGLLILLIVTIVRSVVR